MPTEIKMPQLGESVHEGTIGKWLKRPGDAVAKYEPLVEVITDKVNVEMPSPFAGVLRTILVDEGATVVVGTSIAVIEEHAAPAAAGPASVTSRAAAPGILPAGSPEPGTPTRVAPGGDRPAGGEGGPARPGPTLPATTGDGGRPHGPASTEAGAQVHRRLTPLVRRLADEHRLGNDELTAIRGTGEGGRITKDDVLRYLEHRGASPRAAVPGAQASAAVSEERAPLAPAAPPLGAGDQLHRLSPLRRSIAERMARSKREIPHAYGTIEVDLTILVRQREAHKAAWQAREGVNVSITAFLVRAATRALRAFPMANATFTAEGILYKQGIHFGVGVAIPDGLIVPVIKHADQKGVVGLAKELAQLAARAREGTLALADVSGGTFTLTNPGVFGSVTSMPIINYPQAAILASDAIVRRPAVMGEGIAIRDVMHLGIAFDHRIFDGAVAMQFLNHIKQQLEGFAPVGDSPEF